MILVAVFLLIIGLTKLYLTTVASKHELIELLHYTPVIVDVPPKVFKILLTIDGIVCTLGGIVLFCL